MANSRNFFAQLDEEIDAVTAFLARYTSSCGYPVYTSMDIRDAGWKVGVVDVNLFPAGFNRLHPQDLERGAEKLRQFLSAKLLKPSPWKVALVPEAHTNNKGYLENLTGIIDMLSLANCEVQLAWSGAPIPRPWIVQASNGKHLTYIPMPAALENCDAVILNHDLSGGMIPTLKEFLDRTKTPCFPSPSLGWYRRRKSQHFEIVDGLLNKIAKEFSFFDPFYFMPKSAHITGIDFSKAEDRERLAKNAEEFLAELRRDYEKREIKTPPRLIVKNNAGTYGIGVLSISSPQELIELTRSDLNKMKTGKESVSISDILLQETVPTSFVFEKIAGDATTKVAAEPTIYLVNGLPIGGFLRIHEKLGAEAEYQNLNQPGSILETISDVIGPLCSQFPFPKPRNRCPKDEITTKSVYYFLCKLHATAAGLEECPK